MKKSFAKQLATVLSFAFLVGSVCCFAACGPNDETGDNGGDGNTEIEKVEGSAGLNYKLNDEGTAYVFSDLGTCTDPNVVIGNWYNDLPVTGVAEGACRDDEESGNFNVTVESITVSEGIVDFAFRGLQNWNVRKIILANGIQEFGMAMFRLNAKMKVLVIGTGLETIGQDAFSGLENGQMTIYFRGTQAEWEAVTVESGNDVLSTFDIVYNYTGDGSEL